ncbi:MAG: capsular biosynthesis protein [Candidatus Zixiibacteriota bacterium]|nr:MAG: capsular biosynthesis protein [candidate division Zixibacteria bacterium]
MKISFSPPHISEEAIQEVIDTLHSGWITTGPKTKLFEKNLTEYCGNKATLCVNSATFGLEHILRWFGVGKGDEVIIPAYTYCATANVVVHTGATPVMVDINGSDFNINVDAVEKAITPKTKVIIPVDIAGLPADYDAIKKIIIENKQQFLPTTENQKKLGRILVLSDSAHSFGAIYQEKRTGILADISVFSFHAVKNLTTAEGGAIALNLPEPFDNKSIYQELNILSLHGQSKDALAKTGTANWQYDVIDAGYKGNMTDIQASLGLIALKYYNSKTLPKRKAICMQYSEAFSKYDFFTLPPLIEKNRETSYHAYLLRIKNISETQRNQIMQEIFKRNIAVNVHFQPLPIFTAYKNRGYSITDFPVAFDNYSREISLPVYEDLTGEQTDFVINTVINATKKILNSK